MESVLKDLRQPFVIVNWYGMPDVKCWEDSRESAQQILPSLYKKYKEGAWRMDFNVELCDACDSDNYDCDGSGDESSIDYNVMREEEKNSEDIEEVLSDVSESDDGNFRSSDE